MFGSGLLFLFLSQVISGVFLAMYYVPSADHAHTTVAYITKEVTGGSFLRSIHAYGSSAIIIVLLLHLMQTFLYGSYKGRRELVWVAGCILLTLMLSMAFTGYRLPWDQKAYFATTVGTNILSEIPWVGNALKKLLRGGTEMGLVERMMQKRVQSGTAIQPLAKARSLILGRIGHRQASSSLLRVSWRKN